jgi:hypothetical protein
VVHRWRSYGFAASMWRATSSAVARSMHRGLGVPGAAERSTAGMATTATFAEIVIG